MAAKTLYKGRAYNSRPFVISEYLLSLVARFSLTLLLVILTRMGIIVEVCKLLPVLILYLSVV